MNGGPSKQAMIDDIATRDAMMALRAKIRGLDTAMLTAMDRRYMPSSRPMISLLLDDDGVVWFFAASDGGLAERIDINPRVSITYSDAARGVYVSLSGYARLMFDPDRIFALWDSRLATWFPQGPTDARLALLRVEIDHAEYWDAGSSKMVQLFALARAALTGQVAHAGGEHRRLAVRPSRVERQST